MSELNLIKSMVYLWGTPTFLMKVPDQDKPVRVSPFYGVLIHTKEKKLIVGLRVIEPDGSFGQKSKWIEERDPFTAYRWIETMSRRGQKGFVWDDEACGQLYESIASTAGGKKFIEKPSASPWEEEAQSALALIPLYLEETVKDLKAMGVRLEPEPFQAEVNSGRIAFSPWLKDLRVFDPKRYRERQRKIASLVEQFSQGVSIGLSFGFVTQKWDERMLYGVINDVIVEGVERGLDTGFVLAYALYQGIMYGMPEDTIEFEISGEVYSSNEGRLQLYLGIVFDTLEKRGEEIRVAGENIKIRTQEQYWEELRPLKDSWRDMPIINRL